MGPKSKRTQKQLEASVSEQGKLGKKRSRALSDSSLPSKKRQKKDMAEPTTNGTVKRKLKAGAKQTRTGRKGKKKIMDLTSDVKRVEKASNLSSEQKDLVSAASIKHEDVQSEKQDKLTTDSKTKQVSNGKANTRDMKFIGLHTSISGGLENAVFEAVDLGCRAFGLFLKSQRQWNCKPLEDAAAEKFKAACLAHNFSPEHIVPHGSYLMNCGSPKEETLQKSRDMLVDELQRCEKLGLTLFNFHPGSTCGEISVKESIEKIAESINQAHSKTKYVITVIENMSCQGNTIGGRFAELRDIISKVKDKSRIGVCLDTCHAFAAGYNLRTEEGYKKMMDEFSEIVGFKYLKAVHANDSKGDVGCHLDRHENIGKGKIGAEGFKHIMNDERFDGIPFILETPPMDNQNREIKRLLNYCTS